MSIKKLWREPFVHFFILGVFLFGLDAMLRDQSDTASRGEIVVSAGRIENLAAVFEKTWKRPPTAMELRGLVDTYIRDEALFREGVLMGVDQDDNVIRRRVRQKVDFLVDDLASPTEPEDAELQSWLDEHTETYLVPATYTFSHVFVNPEKHGDSLESEANRLLAELRSLGANVDLNELGDATLLEPTFVDYRADMVAGSFGDRFTSQLEDAPIGEWSGPYGSSFGAHLVYMAAMTPARVPKLEEVRNAVERDWRRVQREAAVVEFHQETVDKYDVTVEWPLTTAEATEPGE